MITSFDGSFMLHRARFVAGKNDTPTRDHTIAIFMNIFLRTLLQFKPSRVYIYFDRERSYHRMKLYADYKGQRKEKADDLTLVAYKEARAFLVNALPLLGFITILEDGIEADDFGYLVAHTYQGSQGVHITDDKDWFGSLFPGWSIFRPKAKEMISYEGFCEMVGCDEDPRMIYLIARAIVGDKSDNIPGIKGVPWDQALQLAPLISYREDLGDGKYAKKVLDKIDLVRHNIRIMTPMWVTRSAEAKEAFALAEATVSKDLSLPFVLWKGFYTELRSEIQREMTRLSLDYNVVAKGLSYG